MAPLREVQEALGISMVMEAAQAYGLSAEDMEAILSASFDAADEVAQLFA